MNDPHCPKVAYVVKRYPRFSETFIVNELLAHEHAGRQLEIISLYPPNDTHFQDTLGRVRAPVSYLCAEGLRAADLWSTLATVGKTHPRLWSALSAGTGCSGREIYQAARLAGLIRERGITHLHAHFASTATSVARMASLITGIPYTFTAHAKDIFHESVDPADLRRKVSDSSGVVTVSDFNVGFLRRDLSVSSVTEIHRIYNGIDLSRFTYEAPVDRRPVIVSVGRLVEKKGFHVLIEACAELVARGVEFRCDLIGTGERESDLRARVQELGLGARVRFLGALPQAEVIRAVRSAALFAAPCVVGADGNADGLPTVLLESMALGTPCVSTDVTGIPEVIRHEATGLLVEQGDAVGLATAMSRLLGDAVLRERLAVNARGLIAREFDIAANAVQQWRVFERARTCRGREAGLLSVENAGAVGVRGTAVGCAMVEEELAV